MGVNVLLIVLACFDLETSQHAPSAEADAIKSIIQATSSFIIE